MTASTGQHAKCFYLVDGDVIDAYLPWRDVIGM